MAINEKDLHRMIWPFGQWKDVRVVNVPLTYLRSFLRDCKDEDKVAWIDVATAEIARRHVVQDHTFVTEHAVERFSQYFPKLYARYMQLSNQYKLTPEARPGQITLMKKFFKKALSNGQTSKAVGNVNGAGNYHVKYRHFRWTYGLYGTGVKDGLTYEYKIISVVPTNNQDTHPFKKGKHGKRKK